MPNMTMIGRVNFSNISKRLRRILIIYAAGILLVTLSSFAYFYFRTWVVFLLISILTFAASYLMPIWFRLFLKAISYESKYKQRLLSFGKKYKIYLRNIYLIKSKRSNACAFSFGNNKTVCFNTNTINNHPWDEIEGVMAHELGHHANKDIYIYTAIVALILIMSSWLSVIIFTLISQNPIILFIICLILSTLLLPIVLAISRWREGMADEYARKILDEPAKLGRFLERMLIYEEKAGEKVNRTPTLLSKIFFTHPWVFDRIRLSKSK